MKKILSFVLLILLGITLFAAAEKWKTERNDERMKLYTRQIPGKKIKEVKAIAFITGTIKEAVAVLFDRLNHPKYFKHIQHTEQLKKTKKCDWSYNSIDVPLITDRDYLVKSCRVDNADGSVSITWEPFVDAKYPEGKDGNIRVTVNEGYWRFWQVGPDELKVEYYIITDPAGSLPDWIKAKANRSAVPQTIWSVHKQIAKWREAAKSGR
ncbi:hypothetical protein KAH37_04265 [bacterium]|nr:hypothetical protein [bacterium]